MADRPVAVTNAGPVIALCGVGYLSLLDGLVSELIVPFDVMLELLAKPGSKEPAELAALSNVKFRPAVGQAPSETILLQEGERAAIMLALEQRGGLVLLDDGDARHVASGLGLAVRGSLGVLIEAKRLGLVSAVRPLVEGMLANGCWFSKELVQRVLASAGEA